MSTAPRRRIDEIGDESRKRILDAAEELFAERGFDRTSFVDIAERSGISRGSIPWHFKNKDGLLIAVVERALESFMAPERYERPPTLGEILDDYAAWVRDGKSALMFMLLTEAMSSTGLVKSHYQEFLKQRRRGLRHWLRALRPEGADPEVAAERERELALAMNSAVLGLHLQASIDPEGIDFEKSLRSLENLLNARLAKLWTARETLNDDA
ncbi:TetR/AcrR family transcriptional regulator [Nonomuraea mesophila]|uniref:TetR/AcrR family transcriptional regulator n=1 Tax=Nonomuraea mesophila TaxID=2530382 RepID=UPI00140BB8AC|nr:TetR/AcrR family transcriptional regulator [Nonomuraea mesophila]